MALYKVDLLLLLLLLLKVDNEPKKPRTPAARIGTNGALLSSEISKTPAKAPLTDDKQDSSRLTASSPSPLAAAAMSIILLTYDFISPHDLNSAVLVRLPVYRISCSGVATNTRI